MDGNANLMHPVHYGPPPTSRRPTTNIPGAGSNRPPPPIPKRQKPPPQQQQASQDEIIYHPALFGVRMAPPPGVGPGGVAPRMRPPMMTRPRVPNVMPRPLPNLPPPPRGGQQQQQHFGGKISPIPPGLGGGKPQPDPFFEEQFDLLEEKMEGLEGELKYAWRALNVLSQEYVKMWQRLEKMEGLLSEQQTVISQLIDLYSVDSSDNAEGRNGDMTPLHSPRGLSSAIPDENFYKALNAVHGDANTDMRLILSATQSLEDFISPDHPEEIVYPNSPKTGKQGTFTDFITQYDMPQGKQKGSRGVKRSSKVTTSSSSSGGKINKKMKNGSQDSQEDSGTEAKSVTTSDKSSQNESTVKSEEVNIT